MYDDFFALPQPKQALGIFGDHGQNQLTIDNQGQERHLGLVVIGVENAYRVVVTATNGHAIVPGYIGQLIGG